MRQPVLRLVIGGTLALASVAACGVDERPLTYEVRALESAGSVAAGAPNNVAGSRSGDGGDVSSPEGGDGNAPSGVPTSGGSGRGAGGSASVNPSGGASGAELGGSPTGGGTTGGANPGGAPAAGGASGGSSGSAGGSTALPCGDLNENGVDDCQETLVKNSRFDATVTGWAAEPDTTQVWEASNASGESGSGSLRLSSSIPMLQAVGATAAGSRQCIPVKPDDVYDLAARVKLGDAQTVGSAAGVNAWLFDDANCEGNLVRGTFMLSGGVVGSWTVLKGNLWIPGGVHSMSVRLVAIKPFVQPALSASFDDVLVAKR